MSTKRKEKEPTPQEGSLTPEKAEAIYKRVKPFLNDLYAHCSQLSTTERLTKKDLEKMAKKHGLPYIPPETLLPVIEVIELKPVMEVANSPHQFLVEHPEITNLSQEDVVKAPWPMVLTQWHLLSLEGSPPNSAFEQLYTKAH